jgi:hypothetical protein
MSVSSTTPSSINVQAHETEHACALLAAIITDLLGVHQQRLAGVEASLLGLLDVSCSTKDGPLSVFVHQPEPSDPAWTENPTFDASL